MIPKFVDIYDSPPQGLKVHILPLCYDTLPHDAIILLKIRPFNSRYEEYNLGIQGIQGKLTRAKRTHAGRNIQVDESLKSNYKPNVSTKYGTKS